MEVKRVKQTRKVVEGTAPRRNDATIIYNKPVKLVDDETGELVAVFLKNAIPMRYKEIGRKFVAFKGTTDARGTYGGQRIGTGAPTLGGNPITRSAMVGYRIPYLVRNPQPILSKTTTKNYDIYNKDLKQFYRFIDPIVKRIDPANYQLNLDELKGIPDKYKISKIITNVTVNQSQMAHYHVDSGNANQYGTIIAFNSGNKPFTGGEFILGNYNIAFGLKEGDIVYTNQHTPHGTLSFKGDRMSVVGYQSKKLINKLKR